MAEVMGERRQCDRRRRTLLAYLLGGLQPRRRSGRRASDHAYAIIDWHAPRVLALVLAILGLCIFDIVLTVVLMSHGAIEVNPFMALFVPHELGWFVTIKLALTAMGMCVLVACSRMRLFRAVSGEALLGLVLAGYVLLLAHQLRMLEHLPVEGM
jgi:hypothetical protein